MDKTQILKKIKEYYTLSTDADFARMLGVTPQALSNWYARNTFDYDILYTKCLGINPDWLFTGKGSMIKENNTNTTSNIDAEPVVSHYKLKTDYFGVERQQIPLFEIEASAGLTTLFNPDVKQVPLDFISVPNAPKCDGAVYVRGDSMYPILKAGDIVCYKTLYNVDSIYYGEMYLIDVDMEGDQYLTFKYIQKSNKGDDYVCLASHNTHHAPKDILKSNIRAIALVKLSIRYNTNS